MRTRRRRPGMRQPSVDRSAIAKRWAVALLVSATALFLGVSRAHANEVKFKSAFGAAGALGGQFNSPAGAAVNDTTGDVYIADRGNNRIQEFNASGGFIRAWGYDVVASGDDNVTPPNEV